MSMALITCTVFSIDNLQSIAQQGILSRARIQSLDIAHVDLSDLHILNRRFQREIDQRPLTEYVPLFFRPLTPMQYKVCVERGKSHEVALLAIDPQVFGLPGVVFTDGNAGRGAKVCHYLSQLEELDWEILDEPEPWSPEYVNKKSAEVLVPDVVPPRYIRHAYTTRSCPAQDELDLQLIQDESFFPIGAS